MREDLPARPGAEPVGPLVARGRRSRRCRRSRSRRRRSGRSRRATSARCRSARRARRSGRCRSRSRPSAGSPAPRRPRGRRRRSRPCCGSRRSRRCVGGERVHAAVGVAHVDAAVGHGGRGVEVAAAQAQPAAARALLPHQAAVARPDRVRAPAVVAEVEPPVGEREAALHGAVGPEAPADAPVARVHRVDRAVLRAEVERVAAGSAARTRCGSPARGSSAPCRSCRRARPRGRRRRPRRSFARWSSTT